ncbi:MAG: Na+:solute symporter [Myxococcales bacterium]|nr:Na+:solute symporter [Myxococcales bacterium]
MRFSLHTADWIVIGLYLCATLGAGIWARSKLENGRHSYFLADRSLPWWWAGISIAATTFAADTPLAITGIIANRGLSGNWLWFAWIGVHAAVVVYFAARWHRSGVVTDAELISLRYSGRPADVLRTARALLYGVVYNCIILGWVLRAMVKIVTPFADWPSWAPGLVAALGTVWPSGSGLGGPSEGLTIIALVSIVALYSSLGGIRGVILTDIFQLALALLGAFWLAVVAWDQVGGGSGLSARLFALYGADHTVLDLFPSVERGWLSLLDVGSFVFGLYLVVQSYANIPADGGGYLMQRLNSTATPKDAVRASGLFMVIHYVVRVWPWFCVGLVAIVAFPVGSEGSVGALGALVAKDRELAYPILMGQLLPPLVLGLMIASLLGAFMSTVDTHINWGASYLVSDLFLRLVPTASPRAQLRVARLSVVGFAVAAVLVSFRIGTIEGAWKWIAVLGAALGVPTALRWVWFRVSATAELGAMAIGLLTAIVLSVAKIWPYELNLLAISGSSVLGLLLGIAIGPSTDPRQLERFRAQVEPLGSWPGRPLAKTARQLTRLGATFLALIAGTLLLFYAGFCTLIRSNLLWAALSFISGALLFGLSLRSVTRTANSDRTDDRSPSDD